MINKNGCYNSKYATPQDNELEGLYTIRIFKNSRNRIIVSNQYLENSIPSYFIECLLYNVPNNCFNGSYQDVFSKTVNCLDKKNNNEPCNGCDSCNEINDGKSMDIIEIDAASHTGVDNVRENIISNARFTPTSRKYKVFIIDEVHMLSISAFNALLKILEEPPQYVIFILATTEIHKVPNTIISRCQRFDFKKIIFNELVDRLRWICTQEGVSVDEKVLSIIAKTANGCVRDAESLLEQILSLGDKKITFEQAELIIPTNNFEILYQLFEYIVKNQTKEAIEQINTIVIGGVDPMRFIDDFIEFTRKVLVYKINKQRENLAREVDESILGSLDKVIPGVTELRLSKIIKKFIDSKEQFKQSYIPQLALEIAVVDLTCEVTSTVVPPSPIKVETPTPAQTPVVVEKTVPEPAVAVAEPVETVNEPPAVAQEAVSQEAKVVEEVKAEIPVETENNQVESAPAAPVAGSSDLLQVWPQIIDKLQKEHYKIYMSIRMSKLISIENNVVILESTSPVGTTDKIEEALVAEGIDTSKLFIAHCPERVLPGQIMRELIENDRIVGGTTPKATDQAVEFYKTFVSGEVLSTDARTAEMAKLTENSFRDTNIAFANELSILCDKFDIDVWELISLTNRHPRVNVLQPGAGVGGHCIAVDPWFIVHAGGDDAKIIRTAREVNTYKTEWSIEKIKNAALRFESENGRKAIVACMGLAFKPDIDDLRESPALFITNRLIADGLEVLAVEPNISEYKDIEIVDYKKAIEKADIVTFLVAHKEFKGLEIKTKLDFCGVLRK